MEIINRRIDELGRFVLPIETRQKLGIEPKNNLIMLVDNESIILKKGVEVDELGRIVIPKHVRQTLGIEEKQELSIEVVNDTIILKKTKQS